MQIMNIMDDNKQVISLLQIIYYLSINLLKKQLKNIKVEFLISVYFFVVSSTIGFVYVRCILPFNSAIEI